MPSVIPVTIAEIDKVLPKIYHGSFNSNRSQLSFKSSVSLKMRRGGFDLPYTGTKIEMKEIAEQVFKERFSVESFDQFNNLYFGSESDEKCESTKEDKHNVDDIVNDLMKAGFADIDDWEDLASDSE